MSPMNKDQQNEILATALRMLALGITPLPVKADGSKRPAIASWAPYINGAKPTTDEVGRWFTGTNHGLGAVMGAASGGLEMLEMEGAAKLKYAAFVQVINDHDLGPLWDRITNGYTERTPRGGYHWLYWLDGEAVPGNTKIAMIPTGEANKLDTLCETRGEGGYVVLAPTPASHHRDHKPWEMKRGGLESIATITGSERASIHGCMRIAFDETPIVVATPYTPRDPEAGDSPGDIFNARASWSELLTEDGWVLLADRGGKQSWRRPGKADGALSATVGHMGYDGLYCFSSSTILPSHQGMDKFGYLVRWRHGGDFRAAARWCSENGYKPDTPERLDLKILASARPKDDGVDDAEEPWFRDHVPPFVNPITRPIDLGALHPDYANLAQAMDEAGVPMEFFVLPALAAQSSLLLEKGQVKMGRRSQPLCLYVNVVGEATEGKSSGYTEAMEPLIAIYRRWEDARKFKFDSLKAQIQAAERDLADAEKEKPLNLFRTRTAQATFDALLTEADTATASYEKHYRSLSNCGPEKLLQIAHKQQCQHMSYNHDEGGLFEQLADAKGASLLTFDTYAGAWDGVTAHRHRAGSAGSPGDSFEIPNFKMSICVMSQRSVLKRAMANVAMTEKGLLPRFAVTVVHPRDADIVDDEPEFSDLSRRYIDNLEAQARWIETAQPFTIDATHLLVTHWNPWRRRNKTLYKGALAMVPKAVVRRLEQTVLRTAVLLHFQHGYRDEPLQAEMLERAFAFGAHWFSHAAQIYGGDIRPGAILAASIVETMIEAGGELDMRTLGHKLRNRHGGKSYSGVDDLITPLQLLLDGGIVAMADGNNLAVSAGRGSPSRKILLRPDLGAQELLYRSMDIDDLVLTALATAPRGEDTEIYF